MFFTMSSFLLSYIHYADGCRNDRRKTRTSNQLLILIFFFFLSPCGHPLNKMLFLKQFGIKGNAE